MAMVSFNDGLIETDLYTKPTPDKHQYLLISSCHLTHAKRCIPYSLALRLRRKCSNHGTYKQRSQELMAYLVNRAYELNFLKTQIQRASDSSPTALKTKPTQQRDTVPFVIIYNPALPNITRRIIHRHSNVVNVLYSSDGFL